MAIFDSIISGIKKPGVLPTILSGAGGAIGGLPSNRTTMPVEPEGYKSIGDLLRQRAEARLSTPFDTAGYEAGGIQNVNDAFQGAGMALGNKLTASGLANSPVAGAAQAKFEGNRAGSVAEFLNTIPEVQRRADMQDFDQVANFYNQRPLGQQQSTSQPGGVLGGAAGGVLEQLGELYGKGAFGGGPKGAGETGAGPISPEIADLAKIAAGAGAIPAAGALAGSAAGAAAVPGTIAGSAPLWAAPAVAEGAAGVGAGAGAAGAGGAAGGGGLLSSIGAFATNPFTIAAAAGIVGTKLWMNSQAHRQANKLTGEGGIQFNLNHDLEELAKAVKTGQMTQQQADPLRQQAFKVWADKALKFGKSGDKKTVVEQMLSSYDWDPALKDLAGQYLATLNKPKTMSDVIGML